ncbi:hypothetical protein HID58_037109 [Brassica napus]|uniref:Transcriptional factor DELLA N-terminal domain-containing protein n=1 Tax=Brassica napus TaxID=3708 RepID=A0ABQ7XID0_BRANA|nr:hypothetical protein HID58_037109 [Brassica napus]
MGKNLEDDNMDDFLTGLGYKVRSSVAEVAQNLEQLELVLAETRLSELNYFPPSPHSNLTVMCNLRPEDDECCSTSSKRIQRIRTWSLCVVKKKP